MTETKVLDFLRDFSSILWEAFPFIVLGAIIAGILEEVVPQQAITRFVPKSKLLAVGLGGALGLIFPMCECGIVPVMRRLLRKGLPLGTCVAYMMAGPIINVIVIASTYIAFKGHGLGPQMTFLRVGLGFIVAVVTGLLVELQYRKYGNSLVAPLARPKDSEAAPPSNLTALDALRNLLKFLVMLPIIPFRTVYRIYLWHVEQIRQGQLLKRYGNIAETALHDFKDIMVFLMLGAVLASLVKFWITDEQARSLSTNAPALTILAMMGLAVIMCLCSEADAFVAASMTTLHPSAKLAFLVLGPMFDLKLLLMFTRVFRRRLIILIVVSAVVQVFVYTLIVHYVWQAAEIPWEFRSTEATTTQNLEAQFGK
jgi:uncharacterized membrane protein YraQ (UPF0718 family)